MADCRTALDLFREHGDVPGTAAALNALGDVATRTGDHAAALAHHRAAAAILEELGDDYEAADTMDRIAAAHAALGDTEQAAAAGRRALARYLTQHRTAAAERLRQRGVH